MWETTELMIILCGFITFRNTLHIVTDVAFNGAIFISTVM